MPELKPEAILTFLGFKPEEITSEDVFKTQFESKFGVKELLLKDKEFTGKIFGQKIGSIEAKVKANAKKMGVEFAPEEIKDKGVEDILELSFQKVAEMNKKAMEDAEKLSKGTADEQVKAWKDKYTQVDAKAKEWEGMATKTAADFEAFKKDAVIAERNRRLNSFKQASISKLEFKQDITPVERMGFETVLSEKYEIDLDDTQNPFPKDKKTGQRIPSTKVTGQFKSFDEILQEELIANKLAKINPQGGKPAPKYGQPASTADGQPAQKTLFIHPNARTAASAPAVKSGL